MAGAGEEGEEVGHHRPQEGDPVRVVPEDAFGECYQVVEPPGRLQDAGGGYHRGDHQHDVDGRCGRLQVKHEGEDGESEAAENAQADAAQPGPYEYCCQYHCEFQPEHDDSPL